MTLPWPRNAEDGTPLGINLTARLVGTPPRLDATATRGQMAYEAIGNIVIAYVKRKRMPQEVRERLTTEDLVADVCTKILRNNQQPGAVYDPRRASFSKYVTVVTRGVVADAMTKASRDISVLELLGDRFGDPHAFGRHRWADR